MVATIQLEEGGTAIAALPCILGDPLLASVVCADQLLKPESCTNTHVCVRPHV